MIFRWIFILFFTFVTSNDSSNDICQGSFFTILADKMPWTDASDDCLPSFQAAQERLLILSRSLKQMDTTLTIYSTLQNLNTCRNIFSSSEYSNILIVAINGKELLKEFGYQGKVLDIMMTWTLTGYTRSSDILRLPLAIKYNQIYIDNDIYFLSISPLDIKFFQKSFVSVNIWQDFANGLEISNCAFCLPKELLQRIIQYQQYRIEYGISTYFYTELGPSMFHKIIMNQYEYPVALYSQNNPKELEYNQIAKSIDLYGHKFLHLTTAIRKGHRHLSLQEIIHRILKALANNSNNNNNNNRTNSINNNLEEGSENAMNGNNRKQKKLRSRERKESIT